MYVTTDQQRAARVKRLLREAERLVEELQERGAVDLYLAASDIRSAAEALDALDFDGGGKMAVARRFEEGDGY
jgi:hypothetical protein